MSKHDQAGSGDNDNQHRSADDHEAGVGIDGRAAHGGDVAPPNADDAGRRQSPESGPIDKG